MRVPGNLQVVDPLEVWKAIPEEGPENLLVLLESRTEYRIDDLQAKCAALGLHTSSWEYMWKAISTCLADMFALSGNIGTMRAIYALPVKLHENWTWYPMRYWPRELEYLHEKWAPDWDVTVSLILLDLDLDPVQLYRFKLSCEKIGEWCKHPGPPPDMKFPYPRDTKEAYDLLVAGQVMKELAT